MPVEYTEKDVHRYRKSCVMVRFTEAEFAKLDAEIERLGYADRATFLRETALARIAGAEPSTKGLPAKIVKIAAAVGVWKALGPEFNPVVEQAPEGAE